MTFTTDLCRARQYSDQMVCECGAVWDVNDRFPPKCPRGETPPVRSFPARVALALIGAVKRAARSTE